MLDAVEAVPGGWADIIVDPVDVHDEVASRLAASELRAHVRSLPSLERVVIAARYGLAGPMLSRSTIARQLRVDDDVVLNVERRALRWLRRSYSRRDGIATGA